MRAKINVATFAEIPPSSNRTDGVERQVFEPQRITRRAPGEGANTCSQLRVSRRLAGGGLCRDEFELRGGILPGRSLGEAAEHLHGRTLAWRRILDGQRHPELLIARESEARGHHADDGPGRAADVHHAADDRRVLEELSLPEVVTEDHDRVRTRHFVRRPQRPAEQRRHAGERKRRRGDLRHPQRFDATFPREHVALAHANSAEFRHRFEGSPPDREVVEHPRLYARRRGVVRLEAHDPGAVIEG